MVWGDDRLDRLNDFIVNDPLYARLDLAQLFGSGFPPPSNILNVQKVFPLVPKP